MKNHNKKMQNIEENFKTIQDFMNKTEECIDKLEEYIDKIECNLKLQVSQVNTFRSNQDYFKEYCTALSFISWFDWEKITSTSLRMEAQGKSITELSYDQQGYIYSTTLDESSIDIKGKNKKDIKDSITNVVYNGYYSISTPISSANTTYSNSSINFNPPTITVRAVVKEPYKYDKEQLYKVYKYLFEILELDKKVSKYTNKEKKYYD